LTEEHQISNKSTLNLNGTIIEVANLRKKYGGLSAVDVIAFSVNPGETYGLLGPNGAGKTTVMRLLSGLAQATSGSIVVAGLDVIKDGRGVREIMGVVTQNDGLDNTLTVFQNLYLYGFLAGLSKERAKERTHEVLVFFGLDDRSDANVYELSGGMKRRLAIARSMMTSPGVVVMDEPTTGLDPNSRNRVWEELAILKDQGVTVVLSTHYMEEATILCDRLAIMDHGKILDQGTPDEMVTRHAPAEVAQIRVDPGVLRNVRAFLAERDVPFREVGALINVTEPKEYGADLSDFDDTEGIHVSYRPGNLEDVFLAITGRELRDS